MGRTSTTESYPPLEVAAEELEAQAAGPRHVCKLVRWLSPAVSRGVVFALDVVVGGSASPVNLWRWTSSVWCLCNERHASGSGPVVDGAMVVVGFAAPSAPRH